MDGAGYKFFSELGWCGEEEVFAVGTLSINNGLLTHSYDFLRNYTLIPIDSQFVCCCHTQCPDVYRGGLPGEVYVSSWFPDWSYKVSFSADTGHTFRHVYVSESYPPEGVTYPFSVSFMSDREPGVFYIIKIEQVEDFNPLGHHTKICIDYYRDYGETLVDTYCHDLTKDYNNDVGIKEAEPIETIAIYPNPATGELRVKSYELRVESVEVFDIYGRVQKAESRKQKTEGEVVLDISGLSGGLYFVRLTTEKGVVVRKIVKY